MPSLHRLAANVLKNLSVLKPGKYGDGGGLWLLKRADGGAQWTFRYTAHGRAGEMGLGSANDVTLAEARELARTWRAVSKSGLNPKKERDRQRAEAARERPTVAMVAEDAFEARKAQLKGDGAPGRWMTPLSLHVLPKIGRIPIDEIDQRDIKSTLAPIWHTKAETAVKAINRLAIVIRHAAAMGVDVDLQAVPKAKALLGAQRRTTKKIPAVPWQGVPEFYQSLVGKSVSEQALRLLILTAARSAEVRLCHVDEIQGDTWILPPERTKTEIEHRVPLSHEAQAVIEEMRPLARGGYLFPGQGKGKGVSISDMTLTALMKRRNMEARPHGFRSSFRTWCAEATEVPREVAETCLAHVTAGKVEAAYRRTDFLERRRVLMQRWGDYCSCGTTKLLKLANGAPEH